MATVLDGDKQHEDGWNSSDWKFTVPFIMGMVFLIYILLWHGLSIFTWIAANLPLLLPLAVTVLSIFTRASDIRNYESVMKMSNDIAIGIISFDIWAISAARSDIAGRVLINSSTMINGDFVLPFLLAGLIIAVGCVVLTNYKFTNPQTKQRSLLVGFVIVVVVYLAPFGILQPVPAKPLPVEKLQNFTVVIPYQDPGVTKIAPTFFKDRIFAKFEKSVEAKNITEAKKLALEKFMQGADSEQFKDKDNEKVTPLNDDILVVQQ